MIDYQKIALKSVNGNILVHQKALRSSKSTRRKRNNRAREIQNPIPISIKGKAKSLIEKEASEKP